MSTAWLAVVLSKRPRDVSQSSFYAAGLGDRRPKRRPNIHDLRHTFRHPNGSRLVPRRGGRRAAPPLLSTYLGHVSPSWTYWYLTAPPSCSSSPASARARGGAAMTLLAPLLEAFFADRLRVSAGEPAHDRGLPRRVPAAARLRRKQLRQAPIQLVLADLDVALVATFLDHLERERGNRARTRNARLAAIDSFFASRPSAAGARRHDQRVLAIPRSAPSGAHRVPHLAEEKPCSPHPITHLARSTRPRAPSVRAQTGLRVSE